MGSGGREHAMVWALVNDDKVGNVICAPGNGGTDLISQNIPVNLANHQEILRIANENKIDVTIVGPEGPLADGIVDTFKKEGLKIFGPDSYGAQLESSKLFARDLMTEKKINQPLYYSCNKREEVESLKAILDLPLVLKADGLAAGKGVFICNTEKEYTQALAYIFDSKQFIKAFDRISVEKCLNGEELSVFVVCDGLSYKVLNTAQDHKRIFDGDEGPNTGGMGAYSPTPISSSDLIDKVKLEIIEPTLEAMVDRGHPYTGFLYIGLMIVKGVPYVIEFNVRLGDPEAQVILPLMQSSFFDLVWATVNGKLDKVEISNSSKTAVAVILASKGYPGSYNKGMRIKGLQNVTDDIVFHAGTSRIGHDIIVNGGRVLNIVAFGEDLIKAVDNAYNIVKKIEFEGKYYRTDIGYRGINMLKKGA